MLLLTTLFQLLFFLSTALAAVNQTGSACYVTPLSPTPVPSGGKVPDDTPQIKDAFNKCGKDGSITFADGNYYIGQVMDMLSLQNVDVSLAGTWTWSTDIAYWLRSSLSVTYAGRSTAWRIGGNNITMKGHGKTLFFGNGQLWYDQNKNGANQNGRPIALTIWHAKNVLIDGIIWRQAQFWHTFVAYSENVVMTNMDMNATSNSQWKTINTDGFDSWNSKNIRLENWTVKCGDDCISVKGNSTNVYVKNATCYSSGSVCIGSVGSNAAQPDYVENVWFEDITAIGSSNAAWLKTYPGTGYIRNVTFKNVKFEDVNQPIYVSSCIYSGQNCDSSRLQISDVTWQNVTGTSRYNVGVGIHCSAAAPCKNFKFSGVEIKQKNGGGATKILCSNIQNQASMGLTCTGSCPGNWPQQLSGNS